MVKLFKNGETFSAKEYTEKKRNKRLYCDFGKDINKETNTKVIRYFKSIQKENIEGINNLTPSYNKLIVSFDLRKTNFKDLKRLI